MTFVGKILIVLILVMSLVFMAVSAATYATHVNWKTKFNELKTKHDELKTNLGNAESLRKRAEMELATERAVLLRMASQVATERDKLRADERALRESNAQLTQDVNNAVAAMQAIQDTLKGLRDQIAALETNIEETRVQRDGALAASIKSEDELAQQKGELSRLKDLNVQLTKQVAVLDDSLQQAGIQINQKGAPRVEGLVKEIRENGLVEVTIGFDDGLQVGDQLEIFRVGPDPDSSSYLAKMKVIRVEKDRAAGKLIPEWTRGAVKIDDRVATQAYFARNKQRPQDAAQ